MQLYLENMEFYAYHGCFKEENRVGRKYTVSLILHLKIEARPENDNLQKTVNYAEVYEIVKKEMEIVSKLIEHVAFRIKKSIEMAFPLVEKAQITVSKHHPPIGGQMEKVSVKI